MSDVWIYIIIGVGTYFVGSFSPALAMSNWVGKRDIRKYGSGNAGTTNIMRVYGVKVGIPVFLTDVLKGGLIAYFSKYFGGDIGMMIGCIMCIVGNNWPLYSGFRGGKGISATSGILFVIYTWPTIVIFAVFASLVLFTHIVSLSSLLGLVTCAVMSFILYPADIYLHITVSALAVLGIISHRANIGRLIRGEEKKLTLKR